MFIEALREFHEASVEQRGKLASTLSDAIISKRVDLAAVRQELVEAGERELLRFAKIMDRSADVLRSAMMEFCTRVLRKTLRGSWLSTVEKRKP